MTSSLSALAQQQPQSTFTIVRHDRTITGAGVPLETLVNDAQPTLTDAKNAMLRVIVTVSGAHHRRVTVALGELDPGFGNHPAYLALKLGDRTLDAPDLVIPGDTTAHRSIRAVNRITVAVENPRPTTPPEPGSLTVQDSGRTTVLSAGRLAKLPAETLQVSFLAMGTPQQHTEVGPTLEAVLKAARVRLDPTTWVAAVGSDGYVAVVTPAEASTGGRPLQISLNEDGQPLTQPRLVVDGDVKGGRYVSDVVDLVVGHDLWAGAPWSR